MKAVEQTRKAQEVPLPLLRHEGAHLMVRRKRRLSESLRNGLCLGAMISYVNGSRNERRNLGVAVAYGGVNATSSPVVGAAHRTCPGLPDVDPADPAARFIAANAPKDLAHFTFEREVRFRRILAI